MVFGEQDLRVSGFRKGGAIFKGISPPMETPGFLRAPSPWKDSKGSQEKLDTWERKLEYLAAKELPSYKLKTVSPDRFKLS